MQIVIEIDEKDYKDTLNGCFNITAFQNAIRYHSTPLPEHHGRLIDVEQIVYEDERRWVDDDYYRTDRVPNINATPTIIPAAKEGDGE